jgi:hypothetical protein
MLYDPYGRTKRVLVLYNLRKHVQLSKYGRLTTGMVCQEKKGEAPAWEFPRSSGHSKIIDLYCSETLD